MSIENCIIGLAIENSTARIDFNAIGIDDTCFSSLEASRAWKAIRAIEDSNGIVNLFTVSAMEPSLAPFLIDCSVNRPIGQNHRYYAEQLLKANWLQKAHDKFISVASMIKKSSNYDEIRLAIASCLEDISKPLAVDSKKTWHIKDVLLNYSDQLEKRVIDKQSGKVRGVSTGIKDLDEIIHGWMPSSINVVAARTSMGKTTLALNFANVAINAGKKVLFFTNEMPKAQIAEKIISLRTGVYNHALFSGDLEENHLDKIAREFPSLASHGLFINDTSGRKLALLLDQVRKTHVEHGLDLIVIDYLQQISTGVNGKIQNRTLELAEITNQIKELALELDVSFICLAQCNRAAENSDESPNLANIRDSGAIEQDADTVIFIHRERERIDGQCDLVVAKNRFGPCKAVQVQTDLRVNKFF